jgi:death-on-curing protein
VKQPHWINRRALILLHAESLAEHGGLPGLRDEAGLEAALARPQHVYSYESKAHLARLAGAYGFGIVRGHPFNDGNKRAGLLAIGLFLRLNGYDLAVEDVEAVETITTLAAGGLPETELVDWIRRRMTKLYK